MAAEPQALKPFEGIAKPQGLAKSYMQFEVEI
jgi:hypothetical protein